MYKYAIEIFYSEDDEGYIAVVPELRGCSAFGETEEEALGEVKIAMELWLETAKKMENTSHNPMEKNFLREFLKTLFASHDFKELVCNKVYQL